MTPPTLTFICDLCELNYYDNGEWHPRGPCPMCSTIWRQCADCGHQFGLDSEIRLDHFGPSCLGDSCASYDPDRDPFNPVGPGPKIQPPAA